MTIITKSGNKYSNQEWSEMQSQFKAEEVRDNGIEAKIDGMIKYLVSQCITFGFSQEKAQTIAHLFRTAEFLEADIQFSDPKNQAFVEGMWVRFDKAMRKLN